MLMLIETLINIVTYQHLISIHLMLMLIQYAIFADCSCYHFNTSHVNVNPTGEIQWRQSKLHFNTSHVNVNQSNIFTSFINTRISIHLMLMLILS